MKKIYIAILLPSILLFIFSNSIWSINKYSDVNIKAKKLATKTSNLNPHVVKLALEAFDNSQKLGVPIKKPIVTVIDYSLPSTAKRLWVLDIQQEKILYNSLVAHGKNSGGNYTTSFSNHFRSLKTSLGVFLTENTYFGRNGYSLRIKGLEKGFNENAKARAIVIHGAPYVNKQFAKTVGRIGRSGGCQAIEKDLALPIINTIKSGTLVLSFYPDKTWLTTSRFINQHTET